MSEFGVIGKKWCRGGEGSVKGVDVDGREGGIIVLACFKNSCTL